MPQLLDETHLLVYDMAIFANEISHYFELGAKWEHSHLVYFSPIFTHEDFGLKIH